MRSTEERLKILKEHEERCKNIYLAMAVAALVWTLFCIFVLE